MRQFNLMSGGLEWRAVNKCEKIKTIEQTKNDGAASSSWIKDALRQLTEEQINDPDRFYKEIHSTLNIILIIFHLRKDNAALFLSSEKKDSNSKGTMSLSSHHQSLMPLYICTEWSETSSRKRLFLSDSSGNKPERARTSCLLFLPFLFLTCIVK